MAEIPTANAQHANTPLTGIPQRWALWLTSVVILLAIFSVIAIYLGFRESHLAYQYQITMALLCFALSSVSCLIFAANAEMKGTVGFLSLTLGGPAVVWVATFVLINHFAPPERPKIEAFEAELRGEILAEGYVAFPDWMDSLGALKMDLEQDQSNQVRQVMDTVYYVGNDRDKLVNLSVQILFVYLDKQTIEFQRFTGTSSHSAELYLTRHPTVSGSTKSVLLARSRDIITEAYTRGQSDWQEVRTRPVDCLIVTHYLSEGMLANGDVLYLNLSKYSKLGSGVTLELAIVAPERIEKPRIWELKSLPFPESSDVVPVGFKELSIGTNETIEPVLSQLSPWMALINKQLNAQDVNQNLGPQAIELLKNARNNLPGSNFDSLGNAPGFQTKVSFRLDQQTQPVVVTLVKQ